MNAWFTAAATPQLLPLRQFQYNRTAIPPQPSNFTAALPSAPPAGSSGDWT
ncbi:hypothetical protein [Rosistilla oblonga]|uniref:hypothetical protein n=1 Tax=Rosistilla oblonga TaxID=2527990 RepID=UPI003A975DFB